MASEQILFPARLRAADFAHFRVSTTRQEKVPVTRTLWEPPASTPAGPHRGAFQTSLFARDTVTGAAGDI